MATVSEESAQPCNPQWEKARQALEKLQTPDKESKSDEESKETKKPILATPPPPPPPNYPPPPQPYSQYNMYGQYPHPYYGGPFPRMPYGPVAPHYPPPGFYPVPPQGPPIEPKTDIAGKESSSNENNSQNGPDTSVSSSNSFTQSPVFNNSFRGGHFQRPPNSNLRFRLPKKNVGPNNAFQFGSGGPAKRWPGPYGVRGPNRPPGPRQQIPFLSEGSGIRKGDSSSVDEASVSEDKGSKPQEENSPEKSASVSGEWPPNLKRYVQKCFACADSNASKDKIESWLKEKLTSAFNKGTVGSIDWDSEPTPDFLSSNRSSPTKKDRRSGVDEYSRYKRGSFPGRKNWSPPGFKARRHRSRSRSRSFSRSRSRSPYSRKGRKYYRHRSRSR